MAEQNQNHQHPQRPQQISTEQVVDALLEKEVPKTLRELESSVVNLSQVAEHVDQTYTAVASTPNTKEAFVQAKQYTVQALASVAYQINTAATALLQSMDAQAENVRILGTEVANPRRKILIQEEQRSRRAISGLTEPVSRSRKKIAVQTNVDLHVPAASRHINYDELDDIGHGVHIRTAQSDGPVQSAGTRGTPQQQYRQQATQPAATSRASPQGLDTSSLYSSITYSTVPPQSALTAPRMAGDPLDIYDTPRNVAGPMVAPPPMVPVSPPSIPTLSAPAAPPMSAPDLPPPPPPPGPPSAPPPQEESENIYGEPLPAQQPIGGNSTSEGSSQGDINFNYGEAIPSSDNAYETIDKEYADDDAEGLYGALVLPQQQQKKQQGSQPERLQPPVAADATKGMAELDLQSCPTAVSLFDYAADQEDELSFKEGEFITVLKKNDDGWFEGVIGDRRGLFPGNYCEEVEESST